CATQLISILIRVLGHRQGINIEIYDAAFDTIDTEILDASSDLYAFEPEAIVLLHTVNALRVRFQVHEGARPQFAAATLERIIGLWTALRQHSQASIIQSNFVTPYERVFGNFEHLVEGSLTDV